MLAAARGTGAAGRGGRSGAAGGAANRVDLNAAEEAKTDGCAC